MKTHGHTVGGVSSRTYKCWRGVLDRCLSPTSSNYAKYGARGISVCDRWLKFENFLADMGEMPVGLSLERRDNNGPYAPENCCWATASEQQNNKRDTVRVVYAGQLRPISEVAKELGVSRKTLHTRRRRGWSDARIVGEKM